MVPVNFPPDRPNRQNRVRASDADTRPLGPRLSSRGRGGPRDAYSRTYSTVAYSVESNVCVGHGIPHVRIGWPAKGSFPGGLFLWSSSRALSRSSGSALVPIFPFCPRARSRFCRRALHTVVLCWFTKFQLKKKSLKKTGRQVLVSTRHQISDETTSIFFFFCRHVFTCELIIDRAAYIGFG